VTPLEELVAKIANTLAALSIEDLLFNGRPDLHLGVFKALSMDELAIRLIEIFDEKKTKEFFAGFEPETANLKTHVLGVLFPLIPAAVSASVDAQRRVKVALDQELVLGRLRELAKAIADGSMSYSIALRLTNIDIDEPFDLAGGVHFHKLRPEVVAQKYPVDNRFTGVSTMVADRWLDHRVEVIIHRSGKPADLRKARRLEALEAFAHSVQHSFFLAEVNSSGSQPGVTHICHESVVETGSLIQGVASGFSFAPHKLAGDEIDRLKAAYILLNESPQDRLFHKAIDRFILGRKRGDHHPNRINEPLWDKIVDYTIALETLFLSANGKAADGELAYRFRLNGAALLSRCSVEYSPAEIFTALKSLYDLRSKVVHANDDSTVIEAANKFARALQIDPAKQRATFGVVSRIVEDWSTKLFFYLGKMPIEERPYQKKNGWEELLWNCPPGGWATGGE
jgi:hypothetical protein